MTYQIQVLFFLFSDRLSSRYSLNKQCLLLPLSLPFLQYCQAQSLYLKLLCSSKVLLFACTIITSPPGGVKFQLPASYNACSCSYVFGMLLLSTQHLVPSQDALTALAVQLLFGATWTHYRFWVQTGSSSLAMPDAVLQTEFLATKQDMYRHYVNTPLPKFW